VSYAASAQSTRMKLTGLMGSSRHAPRAEADVAVPNGR